MVDAREGECLFWAGIVEVGVVDTDAPLTVFLRDNHDIG